MNKLLKYVIKHAFRTYYITNAWFVFQNTVSLYRDFFIVLDLRLTKIGSKALLPFAFLRG